jgi:hypothetical protein
MFTLVPYVAPSMDSIGATSGLVTQLTLMGVLFGPPAFFAAQAASTPANILVVFFVALAVCTLRYPICRIADAERGAVKSAPKVVAPAGE